MAAPFPEIMDTPSYASVRNNETFTPLMFSSEDELSKDLQGATAVAESASPSQHKPYEVD
jgi:hypothetical protein